MYVVLKLIKHVELDTGQRVNLAGQQGCEGALMVFESQEAAEEIYGEGVKTLEIGVGE